MNCERILAHVTPWFEACGITGHNEAQDLFASVVTEWQENAHVLQKELKTALRDYHTAGEVSELLTKLSEHQNAGSDAALTSVFESRASEQGYTSSFASKFLSSRAHDKLVATTKDTMSDITALTSQAEKIIQKQRSKWKDLGFPVAYFDKHPALADGLLRSNQIFAIQGFQRSTLHPEEQGIRHSIEDGEPEIKLEGKWTRFSDVNARIIYDPKTQNFVSRDDTTKTWNFFSPNGLEQRDRFEYDTAYPIHKLSEDEFGIVMKQAQKFYETNEEKDPGIPKDSVVQFYSTPRRFLPKMPMFENAQNAIPVHIGCRIIMPDRSVYSFSIQMKPEVQDRVVEGIASLITAAEAPISMLDYEEFRKFDTGTRMTTSMPLTKERADNILKMLPGTKTFCFPRQNCAVLARHVLREAGCDVDLNIHGATYLKSALPNLSDIPGIGTHVYAPIKRAVSKVMRAVSKFLEPVTSRIPAGVKHFFSTILDGLAYPPCKAARIFTNLATNVVMWSIGGNRRLGEFEGEENTVDNSTRMTNFSRLYRSWKDLFNPELGNVQFSGPFLDWQRKQQSTYYHTWDEASRMTILPPDTAIEG